MAAWDGIGGTAGLTGRSCRRRQGGAARPPDVEEIADIVKVKGRGGTVLQPDGDLIESAKDFPAEGPVLIITDGYCDVLGVKRDHAYLLPHGHRLPSIPVGKVFDIR